jgi:hypothetical protein
MGHLQMVAARWQESTYLSLVRFVGGLLLVLAGVWVVVAGSLYNRLWLDIIGVAMLVLGGYLSRLGIKGVRERPRRHRPSRS